LPDLLSEEDSVIEIDEPPDKPVCSTCGPLLWGWFPKAKPAPRWVDFTLDDGRLIPHRCTRRSTTRWTPSPEMAATAHRGAALARQVLAGETTITEEPT
jgi:hypothetical protein